MQGPGEVGGGQVAAHGVTAVAENEAEWFVAGLRVVSMTCAKRTLPASR